MRLARIDLAEGDTAAAHARCGEALDALPENVAGSVHAGPIRAAAREVQGRCHSAQHNGDGARRCLGESLALYREAHHRYGTAQCLEALAELARLQGDHRRAGRRERTAARFRQTPGIT